MEMQEIISFVMVTQLLSDHLWRINMSLSFSQASSEQVIKVLKSLRSGKLIEMNMYM